jgi:hypothetical protein
MRVLKKENCNRKSLAYTSVPGQILENGASCWDPYKEGPINAVDRVQRRVDRFANHKTYSV